MKLIFLGIAGIMFVLSLSGDNITCKAFLSVIGWGMFITSFFVD